MKLDFNQAFEQALNRPENNSLRNRLQSFQFEISQKILGERISLGLSPNEVARRIGISEEEYRNYENGINVTATEYEYKSVLSKLVALSKDNTQKDLSNADIYRVNNRETIFMFR